MKNYIYDFSIISQCKTGNEFRKNHQPDFSGKFLFFLNEYLFYMSDILVNKQIYFSYYLKISFLKQPFYLKFSN